MEHITTQDGADYVSANDNIGATITTHHLVINRSPHPRGRYPAALLLLPVAKRETHRLALRHAATSGMRCSSAPTRPRIPTAPKDRPGCAGCFTARIPCRSLPMCSGKTARWTGWRASPRAMAPHSTACRRTGPDPPCPNATSRPNAPPTFRRGRDRDRLRSRLSRFTGMSRTRMTPALPRAKSPPDRPHASGNQAVHFNAAEPFTYSSGLKGRPYIDCRKLISFIRASVRR